MTTPPTSSATHAPQALSPHTQATGKWLLLATALLLLSLAGGWLDLTREITSASSPANPTAPTAGPARMPEALPAAMPAGRLELGDPVVTMDVEKGVLRAQLAVMVRLKDATTVRGSVLVSGAPLLDAASKRFFLTRPVVESLAAPGLAGAERQRVETALARGVHDYFASRPVYAPLETGLAVAGLALAF